MANGESTKIQFGIGNFKSYSSPQSIELGKITLVYGSNSSGKSSFIQSLLCALQSSDNAQYLRLNGDFVECGTYESVCNASLRDQNYDVTAFLKNYQGSSTLPFFIVEPRRSLGDVEFDFWSAFECDCQIHFNEGSTPGVLEICKASLFFPQLISSQDTGIPYPKVDLTAGYESESILDSRTLDDVDGVMVESIISVVEIIAKQLNAVIPKTGCYESKKANGQVFTEFTIGAKCADLYLLQCAALANGFLLQCDEDYASPDKIEYLHLKILNKNCLDNPIFSLTPIGDLINRLPILLRELWEAIAQCSKEFKGIKYSINNRSWTNIQISLRTLTDLSVLISNDPAVQKIKDEILFLASRLDIEIIEFEDFNKNISPQLSDTDQKLERHGDSLKTQTRLIENLREEVRYLEGENGINSSVVDSRLLSALARLFELCDQTVRDLDLYGKRVIELNNKIQLKRRKNDVYLEIKDLESLLVCCNDKLLNLKSSFGSLEKIDEFISNAASLNQQLTECRELLRRISNVIVYIESEDRINLEQIRSILEFIPLFLKPFDRRPRHGGRAKALLAFHPILESFKFIPEDFSRNRVLHLGPDRPSPKRSYSVDEIARDASLQCLPEWHHESESEDCARQSVYSEELSTLGIEGQDIVRYNTSDPLLASCSIGILKNNQCINICDLGFGISQVMPLLIAARANNVNLIVVQQPETHLHPAMQANVGDLLIRSCIEREQDIIDDEEQVPKRWLIETHSEVLMLRILRRIREGSFSASDLKIYFVDQREGNSRIIDMKFSASGDLITRWPKGFFAQESMEIF